jgi:hypothetical protein
MICGHAGHVVTLAMPRNRHSTKCSLHGDKSPLTFSCWQEAEVACACICNAFQLKLAEFSLAYHLRREAILQRIRGRWKRNCTKGGRLSDVARVVIAIGKRSAFVGGENLL